MKMTVEVNAKVNLSLYITKRFGSGYHCLDMVISSINLSDEISVIRRSDKQIRTFFTSSTGIDVSGIDPIHNTAYTAAYTLREAYGLFGFDIHIDKRIPLSGGLGGSSVDAAGVLYACSALSDDIDGDFIEGLNFGSPRIQAIALKAGSDVPAVMEGGGLRVEGIGEKLKKIKIANKLYLLVGMSDCGVSSADCYREYDAITNTVPGSRTKHYDLAGDYNKRLVNALAKGDLRTTAALTANDLYPAAVRLAPDIANTLEVLNSTKPMSAWMTGSGAACVALYSDMQERDNAYAKIQGKLPALFKCETVEQGMTVK